MPGLGFQDKHAPAIVRGDKPFTLRKRRKDGREAALGARLFMFTGWRTAACRKFATARVVMRGTLAFNATGIVSALHLVVDDVAPPVFSEIRADMERAARYPNGPATPGRLLRLAVWDGFPSWLAAWDFHVQQGVNMDGVAVREIIGFAGVTPEPGTTGDLLEGEAT